MEPVPHLPQWLNSPDIRPYLFVRPANRIPQPGQKHRLDWFKQEPILKNPLNLDELGFAEQIYLLEERAFGPSNMAMPRWVFYDCAIVPGFVAGFAARTSSLSRSLRDRLTVDPAVEWTPLSLFIIIPTMAKGEWVAHNLCSVNTLLPKEERFYGLGFLSKAFGLWYANVDRCIGMTQWGSPAVMLHSYYGHMEIISAYTPVHSHAETLTYSLRVDTHSWEMFFTREEDLSFLENYKPSGEFVDPKDSETMIKLQKRIEAKEGPFYLSAAEIAQKKLGEALEIYRPKDARF